MWLSRCCEKKLLWRRAGDAGGGWCQLPSPAGQQSHWSEHSDELCQRPQCQIFQCTIVFQCTSHTAHWTINIAVSMWRWWSTEAASCCTFPRRLKRATQSDRAALLSFPLLFCSQLDVRARIWHKSSLPIAPVLAFTVPFCQHQVAVTFSLKPAQRPLSSSVATASLYLWPIQAKLLFLHYLIYAKSKHGSQPFQRQPVWHLDKKNCTSFADLTYCPLQIVLVAFSWFVGGSFFQQGPDSLVTKWQIISSRIIGWGQMQMQITTGYKIPMPHQRLYNRKESQNVKSLKYKIFS